MHTRLLCDFGESAVVIVVIEEVVTSEIGYIQVRVSIIIVIGGCDSLGDRNAIYASRMRNVLEGPIAAVVKQIAGTLLVANKQIQEAIVVYIKPDYRLRGRKK